MSGQWRSGDEDTTIWALTRAVHTHPDRILLDFSGDQYSYGDVFGEVCGLAHGLQDLGIRQGDVVAVMLDNNLQSVTSWFAVNALGAISVPINTAYKGEYLRHQLADSGAKVAIVEAAYVDRLAAVSVDLPQTLVVLVRGDDANVDPRRLEINPLAAHSAKAASAPDVNVKPSDLNAIFYTAGTTGPSKGCMLSHNFVSTLAKTALYVQGRRDDERIWTPLPMFHLNAATQSVLASVLIGSSASISSWFSVSKFWQEIKRSEARVVSLLGSMVSMIAQMDDTPEMAETHGQLRVVWAAPFAPEAQAVWRERFGVELAGCTGYGQSETGFVVSAPLDNAAPPASSGRRHENLDVIIVDENDYEVPVGEIGEVAVRPRAPHVLFEGYWRQPEFTLGSFRNLWYHTGDLGRFDEDGWFYFVDRKQDYLRRRGENISSFEVEMSLLQHPDVKEVAVVGVPSEVSEDDVKAVVVRHDGSAITEEELFNWSIDHVPYFALPRYIEFVPELPKNPVARVLKHQLRQDAFGSATWDRESAGIVVRRR